MRKNTAKKEMTSNNNSAASEPDESNNFQEKVENDSEMNQINLGETSTLDTNLDQNFDKAMQVKDCVASASKDSGSSICLRRRDRQISYRPPRSPSPGCSSSKKKKINKNLLTSRNQSNENKLNLNINENSTDPSIDNQSVGGNCDGGLDENLGSLGMEKIIHEIKIDPCIENRGTDKPVELEPGSSAESPETKRQRMEIISRQCRLHPANKKYNQGPVNNPPPITPGKMVGYTPAGQRYEFDLNSDRPTCFGSEYARMQFDYATRINATRMFHELETGTFLPDSLDPNIERRYFAEQDLITKQAMDHFNVDSLAPAESDDELHGEGDEKTSLLLTEQQLIELNELAIVRLHDFPAEITTRLIKALDLKMTPLMFKKNPIIIDTLEKLALQCVHVEVAAAARALFNKVKALFQVPESREFKDYFDSEVEKLRKKTICMNGLDVLMLTEEPDGEIKVEDNDCSVLEPEMNSSHEVEEPEWVVIDEYSEYFVDNTSEADTLPLSATQSELDDLDTQSHYSDTSDDSSYDDLSSWTALGTSSDLSDEDEEEEADSVLGAVISEE